MTSMFEERWFWTIINAVARYDDTILLLACAAVAWRGYHVTRAKGYALLMVAFTFWVMWDWAVPLYSTYQDRLKSQEEATRDEAIRADIAKVYERHGYPAMYAIPNMLNLPVGRFLVLLGLWVKVRQEIAATRTIGSSVFLTRGTPLAGQDSRRGSESAEP